MMQCCTASFNSKGFQSSLSSDKIPQADHITYEGAFNELNFSIGKKAEKPMQLHIGYSRCQNKSSSFDPQIRDYLAFFTKGCKDGQDRDDRILNAVIVLDISGSMQSSLTSKGQGNRLELAKQAIIMFFSKMRANDAFGLVVFDTKGETIIQCMKKSEINEEQLFKTIKSIKTRGGTTLKSGFDQAYRNMNTYLQNFVKKNNSSMENRIVMLTDVGDNSMANASIFVQHVLNSGIHTTIIGVSDDFKSQTCEKMNQIEGFNYFCATQVDDLKKYLFENFSYTFFPSNYDIEISLESDNVLSFEVFGTVDAKRVKQYNHDFQPGLVQKLKNFVGKEKYHTFTVTKTKTSFPSQLQIGIDNQVKQYGGLVIIKLNLKQKQQKFEGKIYLNYKTSNGEKNSIDYPLEFHSPMNEQFYSDQSLSEAMSAFHYVFQVRKLLEKINQASGGYGYSSEINPQEKKKYVESLTKLKPLAPKSKLKELQKLIKILQQKKDDLNQQIGGNILG